LATLTRINLPHTLDPWFKKQLQEGMVIPACPLALTAERKLDERRQRALVRYYLESGARGIAVGVHTTQFAIRDPQHRLLKPVLQLVADETSRRDRLNRLPVLRIAGICGPTTTAVTEARLIRDWGYHAGLLNLGALATANETELLEHCRRIAEVVPIVGFYLQPAAGGRLLPYSFWRKFAEIDNVAAIKIAPFNRYQTLEVVRAVIESGRGDIALYTGNDDHILLDLLTPFRFASRGQSIERRFVGGLLGQWAVWTRKAVELHEHCRRIAAAGDAISQDLLRLANELTDANCAIFDAGNNFAGCIAGIHEVLRRQGLLEGIWCLDPHETLGPGQSQEIERICQAYPHLTDDEFVKENLERWLSE
jgi:hypothetical protein